MQRSERPLLGNERVCSVMREIRRRIQCCAQEGPWNNAEYLWIRIKEGETDSQCGPEALSREEWLNVVDEAAALGVKWIMISVHGPLSLFPFLWDICAWAQQTHGMHVGLHTEASRLTAEEVAALCRLDKQRTFVFIPRSVMDNFRSLEECGIQLREADPERTVQMYPCARPGAMVYVNAEGQLYTCGMVEGKKEYHLGDVFTSSFRKVVCDPSLPHEVPTHVARNPHWCDGCPPLVVSR